MSAELNKLAAQIVARVRQYGEYRDTEAAADVAAMIRRTVEAQAADVGEITPWLETEEGKAAIAKAAADVEQTIAAQDAARAFDPSAKYSAAVPAALTDDLTAYLTREMPAGTVIGDPAWWAQRIAKAIEQHLLTAGQGAKDSERLDWLEANCTGASNSERYLPFRVYWGNKGATKGIRVQLDKAIAATAGNGEGR